MNLLNFLIVVVISVTTAFADYLMKLAGVEKQMNVKWFLLGLLLYVVTGPCWYFVMKSVKLSSVGVIYGVTTVLVLAALGIFVFHEKLSPKEIIAVIMGVVSIVILAPRFS